MPVNHSLDLKTLYAKCQSPALGGRKNSKKGRQAEPLIWSISNGMIHIQCSVHKSDKTLSSIGNFEENMDLSCIYLAEPSLLIVI